MRVCDYIANQLNNIGIERIYGLMGGGASGLNDGFIKHPGLDYICFHNEQGAGHAAIGEAKTRNFLSVVNPTTGCGGTNCITSVLDAWQDSVPVLFISGNVRQDQTSFMYNKTMKDKDHLFIRKHGIQENNIIPIIESITKYSKFIDNADLIRGVLQNAVNEALSDRKGPVWLDIPSDVQTAEIPDDTKDIEIRPTFSGNESIESDFVEKFLSYKQYSRPLFLVGNGIRQSGNVDRFLQLSKQYNIPYVSTYGARDFSDFYYKLNLGCIGVKGSRLGNMAMQNCDLLIILGTSLNVSHVGYDASKFSPNSYKILITNDKSEMYKNIIPLHYLRYMDLTEFFWQITKIGDDNNE